jgi:Raf kinase inhibitor-like YbhB/YbcL family protein
MKMKISSKDFQHKGMIPKKFTCDDDDISPHLEWSDVSSGTKSFALTCIDPDAPMPGEGWVHWIVINIPPSVREIPQGGPVPGELVTNDFGREPYGGPCPPSGTHRYYFTLSALSVAKLEGVKRKNFLKKIQDVTIDSAIIMGKYSRKR